MFFGGMKSFRALTRARNRLHPSKNASSRSVGFYRRVPFLNLVCFLLFMSVFSSEATDKDFLVYIGTYTGAQSKGIYVSHFDPGTGRLTSPELAAETKNPSFLALHPNQHMLYCVGEVDEFGGKKGGAVSAFNLDSTTGKLTLINQQSSGGPGPCHVAVDRAGKCVLVANYGGGSIAALPIDGAGKPGEPSAFIQHSGSSLNRERQEGPHAHFVTTDPANQFVLTCDLGLDKVLIYRLNPPTYSLSPNAPPSVSIKPGSGPRHLAFHPNGHFIYVINEMGSSLTVFSFDGKHGLLEEKQTISTLPENFTGESTCAEVQVHPSGKFVYGSNRGADRIVVFGADAKTGKLTLIEHQSTQGKTPRHFAIDPTGQWLLAENQGSNSVVVFSVDEKTGRLKPTGQTLEVPAPVCLQFVPSI